jgi:predicted PurR-regulated permease PerM
MTQTVVSPAASIAPKHAALSTLVIGLTLLVFLLLYVFANALLYLFVGVILATALKPMIGWFEQRGVSPVKATLLIYAAVMCAVLAAVASILPLFFDQLSKLSADLPTNYQQLLSYLAESSSTLLRRIAHRLPRQLDDGLTPREPQAVYESVTTALSYGDWLVHEIFALVAVLLIGFYWSLQEERTIRALQLLWPVSRRDEVRVWMATMEAKMGAYVRGQGLLCLAVGVLSFIAYAVIGLPYVTTLAIIAGVLEAVPVFGPMLGAAPPLLLALSIEPARAIWVLAAAIAIQQTENYLLVPRIMGSAVGVNPIATLLAIAAFGTLMGLPGAVLAIPLAALTQMVVDRLVLNPQITESLPPEGRDAASVVRYHAQALAHDVRLYLRNKTENPSSRNDAVEEAIESIAEDVDRLLRSQPSLAASTTIAQGP